LGFYPHNISVYDEALKHKSCARSKQDGKPGANNERLEYLGDAILEAVVSDILYNRYPKAQEGFLTTLRSKLVSRSTLNKTAVQMGLNKFIKHIGPVTSAHNSYMNGNAFEALIGAIYLDRGYNYCMRFIRDKVFEEFVDINKVASTEQNFKSRLIEWCQKYQLHFEFRTEETPNANSHIPKFSSVVIVENIECGNGTGYSKKESQQKAAKSFLKAIKADQSLKDRFLEARNKETESTSDDGSALLPAESDNS
jgi:ribonuclease-3